MTYVLKIIFTLEEVSYKVLSTTKIRVTDVTNIPIPASTVALWRQEQELIGGNTKKRPICWFLADYGVLTFDFIYLKALKPRSTLFSITNSYNIRIVDSFLKSN